SREDSPSGASSQACAQLHPPPFVRSKVRGICLHAVMPGAGDIMPLSGPTNCSSLAYLRGRKIMNQRLLAHIALTAVAFIYACNYLIAKLVLDPGYVRPFGFILLRVTAAVLVFWLVDWLFMKSRVDRKDLPLMA